jgi:hypothetical protein
MYVLPLLPLLLQVRWQAALGQLCRSQLHSPLLLLLLLLLLLMLLLCRYNVRPHWGKCADRSFTHAAPGCRSIPAKYGGPAAAILCSHWAAMLQLQQQYDPLKLFEPDLFGKMAKQDEAKQLRCALDRTCYCRWVAALTANSGVVKYLQKDLRGFL